MRRAELIHGQWKNIIFPPNMGDTRDIPDKATIHPSVIARMKANRKYRPKNNGLEYLSKEVNNAK